MNSTPRQEAVQGVPQASQRIRRRVQILGRCGARGIFNVDCTTFNRRTLESEASGRYGGFAQIVERIRRPPKKPDELMPLKLFIAHADVGRKERQKKIDFTMQGFAFLEDDKFRIDDDEAFLKYDTTQIPHQIEELHKSCNRVVNEVLALKELLPYIVAKFQDLEFVTDAISRISLSSSPLK
jgi:hypothetical protein